MVHVGGDPGFIAWTNLVDSQLTGALTSIIPVNPGDDAVAKVAAAPANSAVVFSSGSYTLADELVPVQDGVALIAMGRVTLTSASNQLVYNPNGYNNLIFSGFTVVGPNTNQGGFGLVNLTDCDGAIITNNVFPAGVNNGAAIETTGCRYATISGNRISTSDYGIVVASLSANGSRSSDYNVIDNNYIINAGFGARDLIFVTASNGSSATTNVSTGNRVTNNTCIDSGDIGIEIGIGCVGTIVSGNVVSGSEGPNIGLRDNVGTIVMGNRATGNVGSTGSYCGGIAVIDQTAFSERIVIANNYCEGNAGPGINAAPDSTAGGSVTITGNVCVDNGQDGIYISTSPGANCTGNTCEGNGRYGIGTQARGSGVSDGMINGNVCKNNTLGGIRLTCNNLSVVGNRCYDDQGVKVQPYGLIIFSTQANNCTIMGNDFQGNLTGAINDDGLGSGHTKLNNKGADNNRVYETGTFELTVASNLVVGNHLSVAGNVGFYGGSPAAKPTVTGAKAGNAALTSLMSALTSIGLVSDSTS